MAAKKWSRPGKLKQSYYLAARVIDMPKPDFASVIRECCQCGSEVFIHVRLIRIAKKSRGIICVPCMQEDTGKPVHQLVTDNVQNTIDVLRQEIDERQSKK